MKKYFILLAIWCVMTLLFVLKIKFGLDRSPMPERSWTEIVETLPHILVLSGLASIIFAYFFKNHW